jgi:hypothetical protein
MQPAKVHAPRRHGPAGGRRLAQRNACCSPQKPRRPRDGKLLANMSDSPQPSEVQMKTVRVATELPTTAGRMWPAMQHPASFTFVTRGLIGVPELAGRTEPFREGECGTGWLLLFHVIPMSRHTIYLAQVDDARTMRSREHGGLLKAWNHTLHVEPSADQRCCYSDTVEIDAGRLTGIVATAAVWIFRYRQRRWRKLTRRHLMPGGPRYAAQPATAPD